LVGYRSEFGDLAIKMSLHPDTDEEMP